LEDLGVGAKVILKWIFMKWDGGVDWTDLAEDREKWWALVKAAISLRVPQNARNFSTTWGSINFSKRTLPHGVCRL